MKGATQDKSMVRKEPGLAIGIADWLVPLFAILCQYAMPYGSLGLLVLLIYFVGTVLAGNRVYFHRKILFLVALMVIQQGIVAFFCDFGYSETAWFANVVTIGAMTIAISAINGRTTPEAVYRAYALVGVVVTCVVICQFVASTVLGHSVGAIAFGQLSEEAARYWAVDSGRPSAFFTEAQTYSSSLLPLVAWSLAKRKQASAGFFSLGIILTTSSLGILLVFLLWAYNAVRGRVSRTAAIVVALCVLALAPTLVALDVVEFSRGKLLSIIQDYSDYGTIVHDGFSQSTSYSNYLRLLKGFDTFLALPLAAQFLGIGRYNVAGYILETGASFPWSAIWGPRDSMANYMSSAFGVLVEYGLVVGLVYYAVLVDLFRKGSGLRRELILLLLAQTVVTQFFFNGLHMFYLLLIFACERIDESQYASFSLRGGRGSR